MAQRSRPSVARRRPATQLQRRLRHCQGLSLVELLVGVVISIVVLGAGVQVLVSLIRGDTATQVELNRKDAVSRVLGLMQDEILNAQRVESGNGLAALSGCTTTPLLILRGASGAEDISYGLLAQATSTAWRGPARLVRCGLPYNTNNQLDTTGTRAEQVVVDSLTTNGFTPTTLGGTGAISRNVQLTLISDASGTPLTSAVQVPISTNQLYGVSGSGLTGTCPGGTGSFATTGCLDPSELSAHYRPVLGGSAITASPSLENVFYFDGRRADYTLSRTPGSGVCTEEQCTVRQGSGGTSITFSNGDVLVFRDIQIRL
jgi:hypothetical protein